MERNLRSFFLHYNLWLYVKNILVKHMVLYIEIVLLVNSLIHVFTIFILKEILYISLKKTFFITFFLDVGYMLLFIFGYKNNLLMYLIPFVFVILSFESDFLGYIKLTVMYFLMSYVLF